MTCHLDHPNGTIPSRNHFCTTCGRPHYTADAAEDCCDHDVTEVL